jgi:glycosyltransferase involved in cell wall biosynthesis
MRIIILLRILWTAGAQKIAINEARSLQNLGHEVELVFLRGSAHRGYEDLLRGVNHRILANQSTSLLHPVYERVTKLFAPERDRESTVDYDLIRAFPSYVDEERPDYLICHDQFAGLAGYYARRKTGVKYSVFIHERFADYRVPVLSQLLARYERAVLNGATSVFAITDQVAESVMRRYRVKATTNLPGFDIRASTPIESKEKALIALSMWDSGRRPLIYLDILRHLPGYRLYFVGNWRSKELHQSFLARVTALGLNEAVAIRTGVSEDELSGLFQRSRFLMRFGWGEAGIGTATVEAVQQCVPLIVNSGLGFEGAVRAFKLGLVLKEIDPEAISTFLNSAENPTAYGGFQENLRRMAGEYTWAKHALALLPPSKRESQRVGL